MKKKQRTCVRSELSPFLWTAAAQHVSNFATTIKHLQALIHTPTHTLTVSKNCQFCEIVFILNRKNVCLFVCHFYLTFWVVTRSTGHSKWGQMDIWKIRKTQQILSAVSIDKEIK